MTTAVIGKWGNTNAIRIPKLLCDEIGLRAKDEVSLNVVDNKIVIGKLDEQFSIHNLIKSWNGKRYNCKEMDWGEPVGDELW